MSAVPAEVRAARAFLFTNGVRKVPPRLFANAAKELDIGFKELLKFIGTLQKGGQGQDEERQATIDRAARKDLKEK